METGAPESTTWPKHRASIDVAICTTCFATIPTDQVHTHAKWHEDHPTKEGVLL